MLAAGFVDEVRGLAGRGLRECATAREALGYREILAFLDGELTLPQAVELLRIKTWQFSRRQATYFKGQLKTLPIDVGALDSTASICERVEAAWRNEIRH